jgi:hypothetical protein
LSVYPALDRGDGVGHDEAVPLPFLPFGALVASLFLGAALTVFALAIRGVDRAATSMGKSVLPGLVDGFRDWSAGKPAGHPADDRTIATEPAVPDTMEDVAPAAPISVERVHRS